jgi:competence protein ComEA
VADAIEAAGGPTRRADLDLLNLAELLIDGMRVEVFQRGETGAVPSSQSNGSILVSLNSADQVELELVPGIGPVTAVAIIARREEIGGFSSLEELLEVDGIGPVTLESIKPYMKL